MVVKLYVADILPLSDDKLFAEYYKQMPVCRRKNIDSKKQNSDKLRSLAAGVLLNRVFLDNGYNLSEVEIHFNQHNKPYADVNFYFNISHSGDKVICAVCSEEIGCDIEKIRDINESLIARCFTEKEQSFINDETKFFRLWTAKESLLKAIGTGITEKLKSFELCVENNKLLPIKYDNINYSFKELDILKDYAITICVKNAIEEIDVEFVDVFL